MSRRACEIAVAATRTTATSREVQPDDHTDTPAGEPGACVMTAALLRAQCKKHGGYSTEELNEKLFLHHFGFTRIDNISSYTGCRVLYISHNALSDLRPLAALKNLSALYAASNAIMSCTMLPLLPALEVLDVSHNQLTDLKGVSAAAPRLETLLAAHNSIAQVQRSDLAPLAQLTTLDVAHNALRDEEKLLSALSHEPVVLTLRTLVLDGNDLQRGARPHFRKRVIAQLPALRVLDALPVFPEEREKAEAFARGGAEAEAAAAAAIRDRAQAARDAQFRYHGSVMAAARGRRLLHGRRETPTTYFSDQAAADSDSDVYMPPPSTA